MQRPTPTMDGRLPFQRQRAVRHCRLTPFLLLAAVVHILLIAFLPLPRVIPSASQPALEVRLVPATQPRESSRSTLSNIAPEPEMTEAAPKRNARQISPKVHLPTSSEVPKNMTSPPVALKRPADSTPIPPQVSLGSLLNSAKSIARDEARRMPPSKEEGTYIEDRAVLPALAKALQKQKEKVGVMRFADGLIKVVTPSGAVYCLRPLPDIVAHGGPIEPTIVPSNCP